MFKLPKWCVTNKFPAFFDTESATAIEQTAKVYAAMNELIDDYNKFTETINKHIEEYESGLLEDYETFKTAIRQEYQNFMGAVDLKLMGWDKEIKNYVSQEKQLIDTTINNFINTMTQNFTEQDAKIENIQNDVTAFKQDVTNTLNQNTTTMSQFTQTVNRTMATMETDHNNFKTEMQNQYDEFVDTVEPMIPDRVDYAENDPDAAAYIKNRPFYEEQVAGGEVASNIQIVFKNEMGSGTGIGTDNIVVGEVYEVDWNGTKYNCEAVEESMSVMLGNLNLLASGNDTGEPFGIECVGANSFTVIKNTSTEETITVSINKPERTILKQFSGKFMEDGYYSGGGMVELLPLTIATGDGGEIGLTVDFEFEIGKTYFINYNGIDYECVGQLYEVDENSMVIVGDGEPFVLGTSQGMLAIMDANGLSEITLSISIKGEIIHKIPNKYLDLDWIPARQKTTLKPSTNIIIESGNEYGNKSGYQMNLTSNTFGKYDYILIVYDGVPYECEIIFDSVNETTCYINPKNYTNSDEMPCFITAFNDYSFLMGALGEHTIEIIGVVIPKMPSEFMPILLDRIILRSDKQADGSYLYYEVKLTATGALTTENVTHEFTE